MFSGAGQTIIPIDSTPASLSLGFDSAIPGKVEDVNGALSVVFGNAKIPLPQGAALNPGQNVTVTLTRTPDGPQVVIAPREADKGLQPLVRTTADPPLPDALNAILESLGNLDTQSARSLLPSSLPPNTALARSLLSLFTSNGAAGDDLGKLTALLQEAVTAGVLPQDALNGVLGFLIPPMAADAPDFNDVVRRLTSENEKALEARLASAIASGDTDAIDEALSQGLRAQIASLRNDSALMGFLKTQGNARSFQQAADNLLDRLSSTQLQNTHGIDHNYLFIELPFAPGGEIRYGQIHFIGDQQGKRGQAGTANATVAIDLSTTRLGDLWITVNTTGQYCNCRFLATTPEVVDLIEKASGELATDLEKTGFKHVAVSAGTWDGNRLAEAARLLSQLAGLNVRA